MPEPLENFPDTSLESAPAESAGGHGVILVIGDDQRIHRLIGSAFAAHGVIYENDFFQALLTLATAPCQLVLVNAEKTARKTAEIARAIRQTGVAAPTVLYGDAFAEIYARRAESYIDDFLVWPLRAAEVQRHLAVRGAGSSGAAAQANMSPLLGRELLHAYHQLSLLIPQGIFALIEQAERILPELLQVAWVRVRTRAAVPDAGGEASHHTGPAVDAAQVLELMGTRGAVGQLLLGPARSGGANTAGIEPVGQLLGTLIQLAQRDASLRLLATTDELTGAYNRRYLQHFVKQMIHQSRTHATRMTLLLFDIDEFKHYNDTYGHAAGDEILQEACQLMQRCCRAHDIVARMGGDEFAVLFWDSGQRREKYHLETLDADDSSEPDGPISWDHDEMVKFMSNRFRRVIHTYQFQKLGLESRGVMTISGGLARYPEDGATLKDLLGKADQALLDAKRLGKNRIVLAQSSI